MQRLASAILPVRGIDNVKQGMARMKSRPATGIRDRLGSTKIKMPA
jgi:hypothetical protein